MTEQAVEKPQKPSDFYTLSVDGARKELFMSAGLLRTIVPVFMNFENPIEIFNDPFGQSEVLTHCLAPRTPNGKQVDNFDLVTVNITNEECNDLLTWVTEHVLHFFIMNVTAAQTLGHKVNPYLNKMMESLQSTSGSAT